MKGPQSWASSIVGLAFAMLLAGWALKQFVAVVLDTWPVLMGIVVCAGLGTAAFAYWRRPDRW